MCIARMCRRLGLPIACWALLLPLPRHNFEPTFTLKCISHALFDSPIPNRPHILFLPPPFPPADDMPALFARSFSFTSDAAGLPRSSHYLSLALPSAWFRRLAASLRPTNGARRCNTDKSAAGHRGKFSFLSQSRLVGAKYQFTKRSLPD